MLYDVDLLYDVPPFQKNDYTLSTSKLTTKRLPGRDTERRERADDDTPGHHDHTDT